MDSAPPSAGLYVHVPYCETKCGYCDFYSVPVADRDTSPLVDGILLEMQHRLAAAACRIRTVFVGGGTPTILFPEILARLLAGIRSAVRGSDVEEFTVEANPATVDDRKSRLLVNHGVTRVSMGAQSFIPAELAALERLHSPDDIAPSVNVLRRHGVARINLDLIFGIPGQSLSTWGQSLTRAMELSPDHVACYGLTYEPNTPLTAQRAAGRVRPCDEGLEAEMYLYAIETLAEAGYRQYEISNFARPGCECLHNLIYWRNQPFIGIGPSAAGFVDDRRYKNVRDIAAYVRHIDAHGIAEAESETIGPDKFLIEMLMMQLRLNEGLSVSDFERRIGADPLTLLAKPLERLQADGLVEILADPPAGRTGSPTSPPVARGKRIALTSAGRLVADSVILELAAAETARPVSRALLVLERAR